MEVTDKNYSNQEEFIINDILLRINATDIQVFDQNLQIRMRQ